MTAIKDMARITVKGMPTDGDPIAERAWLVHAAVQSVPPTTSTRL